MYDNSYVYNGYIDEIRARLECKNKRVPLNPFLSTFIYAIFVVVTI